MDEPDAAIRARQLTKDLTMDQVRLPLSSYIKAIAGLPENLVVKHDETLDADAAGHTVFVAGRHCIVLNGKDPIERQRFTACHEIGHIVLGLPTKHEADDVQFARRSRAEVLCDVFAAELLLPSKLVRPLVENSDLAFSSVETLSNDFGASLAATGSRFASLCDRPCAFVLTRNGAISYASISKGLKEHGGRIRPGERVPPGSVAAAMIGGRSSEGATEVEADEWFEDWGRGGKVLEEARHFERLSQTLSLLWFEDDDVPSPESGDSEDGEEPALQPLTGVLPWPGKRRRR